MKRKVDKPFLILTITLLVVGLFIFSSASLGLLAKGSSSYWSILFNQLVLGLCGGLVAMYITSKIPYIFWRKYAFYILIIASLTMLLTLVPFLRRCVNGACRWIEIGGQSLQPSEIFKIAFVMYVSCWFAAVKHKIKTWKFGTMPFVILIGLAAILVLLQRDTDTLMVIILASSAIYLTAGGRWRDLAILGLIGAIGLTILVFQRPYLMNRIQAFIDPSKDALGSSYQVQQSLIAIGSGGLAGRGFGQSIQKFSFLPYPMSDSIFAVAGEEFGFIGSITIIALFVMLAFRGLRIARLSPEPFGMYLTVGIISLIIIQSFLNIAAMLAIIPLSGTPLLFVSHGGTAMFFTLASLGIILNISKYQTKKTS